MDTERNQERLIQDNILFEEGIESNSFKKAINLLESRSIDHDNNKDNNALINCFNLISRLNLLLGKNQEAVDQSLNILSNNILKNQSPEIEARLSNTMYCLGAGYNLQGKYKLAKGYLDQAIQKKEPMAALQKESVFSSDLTSNADVYFELAHSYRMLGDFDHALRYLYRAIPIYRISFGDDNYKVARTYNQIGLVLWFKKEYKRSKKFLKKAKDILEPQLPAYKLFVAEIYNDLGLYHWAYGKVNEKKRTIHFDKSNGYFEKSIDYFEEVFDKKNHYLTATCYNDWGMVHEDLGILDKSFELYKKALDIRTFIFGDHHPEMGRNLNNLGVFFKEQGKFKEALSYFQRSIVAIVDGFTNRNNFTNPTIDLSKIDSNRHLLYALEYKALTLLDIFRQDTDKIIYIETACKTLFLAIDLVEQTVQENIDSELFYLERVRSLLDLTIGTIIEFNEYTEKIEDKNSAWDQFKIEETLMIAEKGKSILHLDFIQNNFDTDKKDNSNQYEIERYMNEIEKILLAEKLNDILLIPWQDGIDIQASLVNNERKRALEKTLEKASVKIIQKNIKEEHTAVVNYFFGTKNIYAFVITKNDYFVFNLLKDKDSPQTLEKTINNIIRFKKNWDKNLIDFCKKAYLKKANQLYRDLFQPLMTKLSGISKLYILPHYYLSYIPFEALLTKPAMRNDPYSAMYYLIDYFEISYHYSATLLYSTSEESSEDYSNYDYAGFSPTEQAPRHKNKDIEIISEASSLVKSLSLNGASYLNKNATKKNFFKEIQRSRIVHISSHGIPLQNDLGISNGGIEIRDEKGKIEMLSLNDIILYNIKSELIILDSCSTGDGFIIKGEGIKAINRIFSMSGAKNIIYTFFTVPLVDSYYLVSYFLELIYNEDLQFSNALWRAKRRIMKTRKTSPKSWAGYAFIGNQLAPHQPLAVGVLLDE